MPFPDVNLAPGLTLPGYTVPQAPGTPGVLTNDGTGNLQWLPAGTGPGGPGLPAANGPDLVMITGPTSPWPPTWSPTLDGGRW